LANFSLSAQDKIRMRDFLLARMHNDNIT